MSEENDVFYILDPSQPLSAEQKASLKALAAMPDETIDYSDIPPLTEKFWRNAILYSSHRKLKDAKKG